MSEITPPPSSSSKHNISTVVTHSGYEINPSSDVWVLSKDVTIHLEFINKFNDEVAEFFRRTLVEYARIYRPYTVKSNLDILKAFSIHHDSLDIKSFSSFTDMVHDKYMGCNYPMTLKSFIYFGIEFGFRGVPNDLKNYLKEVNLSKRKDVTIKSVENQDIFTGPFSDIEFGNIVSKSLDAYTSGQISLEQYSAIMFFAETGRRRIQLSDVKVKDIEKVTNNDGISNYFANVPRGKQPNQRFREAFNKCPISEDLWIVLTLQAASVKQYIVDTLKIVDECLLDELPLYLDLSKANQIEDVNDFAKVVRGDRLHKSTDGVGLLVASASQVMKITSERTGGLLNITPHRFRHTVGNNAAREGYGYRVIAEILDHTTDVVAGVYVKNAPDIVGRLDRAMAFQLAPLAQAFAGEIVKNEENALRGNDPSSRIQNESSVVGSCGSYGFCAAAAPIACYTCKSFQPWLDAPHENVLTHLLRERERLKDVADDRIATVNDRLILAVAEVIQCCANAKANRLK